MMTGLFDIGQSVSEQEADLENCVGKQGAAVLALAARGVAFLPGFLVGIAELREDFEGTFTKIQQNGIPKIEKITGRLLCGQEKPLTLKVTLLPDVPLETNPVISWLGMAERNPEDLVEGIGETAIQTAFDAWIESFLAQLVSDSATQSQLSEETAGADVGDSSTETARSRLMSQIPREPSAQLRQAIAILLKNYDSDLLNQSLPASMMIQYLPIIDREDTHTGGSFVNRDPVTGRRLQPGQNKQNHHLSPEQTSILEKAVSNLESWYLHIRQVNFLIDDGRVWITEEFAVKTSVHARLKILSELFLSGQITEKIYVNAITPKELGSVFYPKTDPVSTMNLIRLEGGIAGSPGASSGRVYFSAGKLQSAYWQAKAESKDPDLILLKESTHAEDIEAIQLSCGVISSKGGYASHAPIVARYLGKPSLIYPGIEHYDTHAVVGGHVVKEGQRLTIDIQDDAEPVVFIGKAEIQPVHHDSDDLNALLTQARKQCLRTNVRANAETETELRLAKEYGAAGIGLCRTEHMLLETGRRELLHALLISGDETEKAHLQAEIGTLLSSDFLRLFRIMGGLPLTIRLLDASLQELFPDSINPGRLKNRLKQTNPMLGHRGCRLGISMPELYEMQVRSILEAALQIYTKERIAVRPEVLIPFVMSPREMVILRKGITLAGHSIKGINAVSRETALAAGLDKLPFDFKVGAMIEIPSAALSVAKLVHHAEIISFGTNDLTQTTLGISRDDIGSLLPLYEELNIWEADPFQNLTEPVKHLIDLAVHSGRAVRPDLETGICGEHSANPDVIRYAIRLGLDYVSCAARYVPMTILTAAQIHLEECGS